MYIVKVDQSLIKYFLNIDEATKYAESESKKCITINDDCCSYSIQPRIVIHEIELNTEYDQDCLHYEYYAIKKYNDFN